MADRNLKNELLAPAQDRMRWVVATVVPTLAVLLLFIIPFREVIEEKITPPELKLTYVIMKEPPKVVAKPQEPVKKTPKKVVKAQPKPKKVVKKVVKPTEKAPIEEVVKEKIEEVKEEPVEKEVEATPVKSESKVVSKAVERIVGASQLDNTSFEPLFTKKPIYPQIALINNIEGSVTVKLTINAKGRIEKWKIIAHKGHPAFKSEVAKVIGQWRFPPPYINGEPRSVEYDYTVRFTLT